MSRNPLGSPDEVVSDLRRSHEPCHLKPDLVPGAPVHEQIIGNLVIRVAQDLLVLPRNCPDAARNDMTNRLKIADVEVDELGRGRIAPELVSGEVEAGKAQESSLPAPTRGVHGNDGVGVVLQEGHAVSGAESNVPPAKIREAGSIDQNRTING